MRKIVTFVLSLVLFVVIQQSPVMIRNASAQTIVNSTPVSQGQSYYCAKCGTYHTRPIGTSASIPSNAVSSGASHTSYRPSSSGASQNVLSMLNSQRARQGIAGLRYDPQLQAVAEQRAQQMASMGLKNHPPGSFAPGRFEGVGWSSSFSPSGVSACYTSDTRMQYAGAAMATGRDGVYFAVVYR